MIWLVVASVLQKGLFWISSEDGQSPPESQRHAATISLNDVRFADRLPLPQEHAEQPATNFSSRALQRGSEESERQRRSRTDSGNGRDRVVVEEVNGNIVVPRSDYNAVVCAREQRTDVVLGIVGCFITLVSWIIFSCAYYPTVTQQRKLFPLVNAIPAPLRLDLQGGIFFVGICSCFDNVHYCCHGCCCWPTRVADTWAAAGVASFWAAFALAVVPGVLSQSLTVLLSAIMHPFVYCDAKIIYFGNLLELPVYFFVQVFVAARLAADRARLRRALGQQQDVDSCQDFMCYWICACCVAIQDARHTDLASGTEVRCCCQLLGPDSAQTAAGTVVVGQAIAVGQPGQAWHGTFTSSPPIAMGVCVPAAVPEGATSEAHSSQDQDNPVVTVAMPVRNCS